MKRPSNVRTAIKSILYRFFHPALIEKMRSLINLRLKYFPGNRHLIKQITSMQSYKSYISNISDGLELLVHLHELFPKYNNQENYEFETLKSRARIRFDYLVKLDIDLKGRDVTDVGAGHGETLFVVDEFELTSATALDYTDSKYKKYRDHLTPSILDKARFITQDLLKAPLPEKSTDIIVSSSAFEHFMDPETVVDNCYRALRQGGILYTDFAGFHAPYASHRKIYTGIPYVQNIFTDKTAFEFFYEYLKINSGINRYTGEKITDGNPYPEVNRLSTYDWEQLLLNYDRWEVIHYSKVLNYQFKWFNDLFPELKNVPDDYLYADDLKFVLRKK